MKPMLPDPPPPSRLRDLAIDLAVERQRLEASSPAWSNWESAGSVMAPMPSGSTRRPCGCRACTQASSVACCRSCGCSMAGRRRVPTGIAGPDDPSRSAAQPWATDPGCQMPTSAFSHRQGRHLRSVVGHQEPGRRRLAPQTRCQERRIDRPGANLPPGEMAPARPVMEPARLRPVAQ